jgi:hypothetical protein
VFSHKELQKETNTNSFEATYIGGTFLCKSRDGDNWQSKLNKGSCEKVEFFKWFSLLSKIFQFSWGKNW